MDRRRNFSRIWIGLCLAALLLSLLAFPTIPAQSQNVNQWDVTIYLSTSGDGVKSSQANEDIVTDFGYTCIPGRALHPEHQVGTAELSGGLVLTGDGRLRGIRKDPDRAHVDTSCAGSVNGKVDLERGSISFSGKSDQVWDIPAGVTAGHYEIHVTFSGAASFSAVPSRQPPVGAVPGTFDFTYRSNCIHCSAPNDETFTGSLPLTLYFWPSTLGPWAQLDRTEAARFSAIQITGGGFKPETGLKIMIGDKLFSHVTSLPVTGAIPANTWMWAPDDTPFGLNKVWVEQDGSEVKSNLIDLNVVRISRQTLVQNFDEVVKQYLAAIPPNDRWAAWAGSQGVKSIVNDGKPAGDALLWLPTAVLTLGQNQDQLWPDNQFRDSWYQAEVLEFLRTIRFDPDPARRALLDGLDFGPFNSGVAKQPAGAHFFVVVWPHGPALDPQLEQKLKPTWDNAGITFDPWPKQSPEIFELNENNAAWAFDSAYKDRWQAAKYNYLLARSEPASWGYNTFDFPITGGNYYSPTPKGAGAFDPKQLVGAGGEPPKMLAVQALVTLALKDSQGHKASIKTNGSLVDAIPNSAILVALETGGAAEWYVILPPGRIDVTITGAGAGSYQLVTKRAGKPIQVYPQAPLKKGEKATLSFGDEDQPPALHTAAGQDLSPIPQELASPPPLPTRQPLPSPTLPASAAGQPTSDSSLPRAAPTNMQVLLLVGGLAGSAFLLAALVVVIILLLRQRKTTPSRTDQSGPPPP